MFWVVLLGLAIWSVPLSARADHCHGYVSVHVGVDTGTYVYHSPWATPYWYSPGYVYVPTVSVYEHHSVHHHHHHHSHLGHRRHIQIYGPYFGVNIDVGEHHGEHHGDYHIVFPYGSVIIHH